jgi:hypothetical protein
MDMDMAAASIASRAILFCRSGRLVLRGMKGGAFRLLISTRNLGTDHQKDGYCPKYAEMLKAKFHFDGHIAEQPKIVNTSLKNRQKD